MGRSTSEVDYALFEVEQKMAKQENENERLDIAINILFGLAFSAISTNEVLRLDLAKNGVELASQGSAIWAIIMGILALAAAGLAVFKMVSRYKRIGRLL